MDKDKIIKMINAYWKFDNDQQPTSNWHDKQDLITAIEQLSIPRVSKSFVLALETTDFITKGKKYELVESEGMGHYIIDETGEESFYHCTSLNVC